MSLILILSIIMWFGRIHLKFMEKMKNFNKLFYEINTVNKHKLHLNPV